jgi:hypothetical protein
MKDDPLHELAEVAGIAKALFTEFEIRLGEVMATQRIANQEMQQALAKSSSTLTDLLAAAKATVEWARQTQTEVQGRWPLEVTGAIKVSGREIAREFATELTQGVAQQVADLTDVIQTTISHFNWTNALKWSLGFALAVALSIAIGVSALLPNIPGLDPLSTRSAMARAQPCQVGDETHVCVLVEDLPRVVKGQDGRKMVVIRGL